MSQEQNEDGPIFKVGDVVRHKASGEKSVVTRVSRGTDRTTLDVVTGFHVEPRQCWQFEIEHELNAGIEGYADGEGWILPLRQLYRGSILIKAMRYESRTK
jgi:hypothetical protein